MRGVVERTWRQGALLEALSQRGITTEDRANVRKLLLKARGFSDAGEGSEPVEEPEAVLEAA